jgi:hypothetical protein
MKWLGFSQKVRAKELLEKSFKINTDYKKLLSLQRKQYNQQKGGHNKETFMLNIETFKKYSLMTHFCNIIIMLFCNR